MRAFAMTGSGVRCPGSVVGVVVVVRVRSG